MTMRQVTIRRRCYEPLPDFAAAQSALGLLTKLEVPPIRAVRWLAVLPFLAMLVGPFFVNRVTPYVFGLPFLLAWLVAWIVLTAVIMAVIFRCDPANREDSCQ